MPHSEYDEHSLTMCLRDQMSVEAATATARNYLQLATVAW